MDGTPIARDAAGITVLPQASGGLNKRLAAICDAVSGRLLIIGMETPQVSRDHVAPLLHDWSAAGARHEAWMGPATDGGFGRWRCSGRTDLIRGVPMSDATTGARQLARLAAAALSVGMLPELVGPGPLQ